MENRFSASQSIETPARRTEAPAVPVQHLLARASLTLGCDLAQVAHTLLTPACVLPAAALWKCLPSAFCSEKWLKLYQQNLFVPMAASPEG